MHRYTHIFLYKFHIQYQMYKKQKLYIHIYVFMHTYMIFVLFAIFFFLVLSGQVEYIQGRAPRLSHEAVPLRENRLFSCCFQRLYLRQTCTRTRRKAHAYLPTSPSRTWERMRQAFHIHMKRERDGSQIHICFSFFLSLLPKHGMQDAQAQIRRLAQSGLFFCCTCACVGLRACKYWNRQKQTEKNIKSLS